MFLQQLPDGWLKFGNGIKWRCIGPNYLCEVANPNHIPVSNEKNLLSRLISVRYFYEKHLGNLGLLDSFGYGIDALVANAFAESSGCVPSPLNTLDLEKLFDQLPGSDISGKLDFISKFVKVNNGTRGLVAFEPGYISPVTTSNKISLGAHQQLVCTAGWLFKNSNKLNSEDIKQLVLRLPTDSKYAADLAAIYFNKNYHQHQNQPPLMAACYNAGSLHESINNLWNLRSTGNHIDRWVKFFNMSRSIVLNKTKILTTSVPGKIRKTNSEVQTILPAASLKNVGATNQISIETVLAALKKKNYLVREADDKNYNLNLVGIRNSNARVDYFDDNLFVFWKYQGKWNTKIYNITTFPGIFYLREKAINPRGTAILKEGQYKNSHQIGFHNRSHPVRQYRALIQVGNLKVYRDNNKNGRIELDEKTLQTGSGFSVNIHHAKGSGLSLNVGPYSAGCQVFASFEQWTEFNTLFDFRNQNWGDIFTYTLINQNDL